jgi:hypothetical protein
MQEKQNVSSNTVSTTDPEEPGEFGGITASLWQHKRYIAQEPYKGAGGFFRRVSPAWDLL